MPGDDDRIEVAVQSYGLYFRQGVAGLGIGNEGHAVGGAQFVQHLLHVGVELETIPGDPPVELGEDHGQGSAVAGAGFMPSCSRKAFQMASTSISGYSSPLSSFCCFMIW